MQYNEGAIYQQSKLSMPTIGSLDRDRYTLELPDGDFVLITDCPIGDRDYFVALLSRFEVRWLWCKAQHSHGTLELFWDEYYVGPQGKKLRNPAHDPLLRDYAEKILELRGLPLDRLSLKNVYTLLIGYQPSPESPEEDGLFKQLIVNHPRGEDGEPLPSDIDSTVNMIACLLSGDWSPEDVRCALRDWPARELSQILQEISRLSKEREAKRSNPGKKKGKGEGPQLPTQNLTPEMKRARDAMIQQMQNPVRLPQ